MIRSKSAGRQRTKNLIKILSLLSLTKYYEFSYMEDFGKFVDRIQDSKIEK